MISRGSGGMVGVMPRGPTPQIRRIGLRHRSRFSTTRRPAVKVTIRQAGRIFAVARQQNENRKIEEADESADRDAIPKLRSVAAADKPIARPSRFGLYCTAQRPVHCTIIASDTALVHLGITA